MTVDCYQTKNATIVSYPPFSGGKFLTNCLSLSKHACPQNSKIAEYLLKNPTDYDYRLGSVLTSLPNKAQMKNWRSFEFGDDDLFGHWHHNWRGHRRRLPLPNNITQKLCKSGLKFFMVDHSMEARNLLTVWPNATVIKLINTEQFQTIAAALKNKKLEDPISLNGNYCRQKYNQLRGNDWPEWNEFARVGYDISKCSTVTVTIQQEIEQFYSLQTTKNQVLFNMDDCIFDTDRFLDSMKKLYVQMGFDDFQQDLVKQFYTAYISLHI